MCSSLLAFTDPATTEIYTLSLHDALPISMKAAQCCPGCGAILPEDRLAGICPACAWRELSGSDLIEDTVVALPARSEEHTSELQSHSDLVCRLLLEKKKTRTNIRCRRNAR